MKYNVRPSTIAREASASLDSVLAVMNKLPVVFDSETRRVLRCLTNHRIKTQYVQRCEVLYLLESLDISAGELARRLNIDRRQILRYIDKTKSPWGYIPILRKDMASAITA